jgi:hypothetical protein
MNRKAGGAVQFWNWNLIGPKFKMMAFITIKGTPS